MSLLLNYSLRRSKQPVLQLFRSNAATFRSSQSFQWLFQGSFSTTSSGDKGSGRSNFDRDVLLPASRGELGSSSRGGGGSMIPKLAARRNTANLFVGPGSSGNAMTSMKYAGSSNDHDEDRDVDPKGPFYDRHAGTMMTIASAYSRESYGDDIDDGSVDTDPKYVLLNADMMSPSISDQTMVAAERELEYITQVLIETVRDVAELAIIEASEQQQESSTTNVDTTIIEQNERRKESIRQKLQNTEYRILNADRNKFTTNGIHNSSLQYLETNLKEGIKYDGSPSMPHVQLCHTNPYLPHNKYYIDTDSAGSNKSKLSRNNGTTMMIAAGFTNDPNIDFNEDLLDHTAVLDPNNNVELQMIQQDAIIATAKVLELDMEFGYWNEMDYDHLIGFDGDSNARLEMDELSEFAKEDLKKKEALAKLLKEAELERKEDADYNEDEELTATVDDKSSSGSGNGRGGKVEITEPVLSPQEQKAYDFMEWFDKKNDVVEYENDPELMTEEELQNLSPELRQQFQELKLNLKDTADPIDPRDELYGDHPNMVELCSGSDEYIHVEALHPHQKRQPKPTYRTNVKQPDALFLNQYCRFAYVNKLPPIYLESNDSTVHPPKLIDINNPVDRTLFQRNVANMMNIDDIDQIYPTSTTSAFIGYKDAIGLATTLMNGPNYDVVLQIEAKVPAPYFQALPSNFIDDTFVTTKSRKLKLDPDKSIILLSNLDISGGTRYTPVSLVKALFSSSSVSNGTMNDSSVVDIGNVAYGNVTADDIQFLNATTAIVQFALPEQASSVLDSDILRTRLRELNSRMPNSMTDNPHAIRGNSMNQRIEVFRSRRELIHRGWDTKRGQYRGTDEILVFGNRLIIDGDMPTKEFYISHAAVVMLSGVDPSIIRKRDISNFVQPFCTLQRDIEGSIEWVECNYTEQRTDRVYVGFDLVGDADAFVKAIGGTTKALYKEIDGHRHHIDVKLLHDRQPPNYAASPLQRRPDRTIENILNDMNNWEQYVDVADIEFLDKHGIGKHVLNEALRAIRFNNESFGTFDSTVSAETLEPSTHMTPGQHYRDLVQLYVKTLKDCVATPENPGEIFTMLQFPNEEPDLGYFDHETKRLERIKKERISSNTHAP